MTRLRTRVERVAAEVAPTPASALATARTELRDVPMDELRARYDALTSGPYTGPPLDGLTLQEKVDLYHRIARGT